MLGKLLVVGLVILAVLAGLVWLRGSNPEDERAALASMEGARAAVLTGDAGGVCRRLTDDARKRLAFVAATGSFSAEAPPVIPGAPTATLSGCTAALATGLRQAGEATSAARDVRFVVDYARGEKATIFGSFPDYGDDQATFRLVKQNGQWLIDEFELPQ